MSELYKAKNFLEEIEENKLESRRLYQKRQQMAEEQRKQEAQAIQEHAKTDHQLALERTERLRLFLNSLEVGNPLFSEQILSGMMEIVNVFDYLLEKQSAEKKSGDEDGC